MGACFQLNQLSFAYGRAPVLRDLTLELRPAELTAVPGHRNRKKPSPLLANRHNGLSIFDLGN